MRLKKLKNFVSSESYRTDFLIKSEWIILKILKDKSTDVKSIKTLNQFHLIVKKFKKIWVTTFW